MSSWGSSTGVPMSGRYCVQCGREIPWEANVCMYCGHDYRASTLEAQTPRRTSLPIFGGVAILIAGVLAIIMALAFMTMTVNDIQNYEGLNTRGWTAEEFVSFLHSCGIVDLVFGVLAVIGSIFALKRTHFGLAVVGGVFAFLGFGFVVGTLIGLIGLILVVVARREFH